jgi:hypothetical protein
MSTAVLNRDIFLNQGSQSLLFDEGTEMEVLRYEGDKVVLRGPGRIQPCNGRHQPRPDPQMCIKVPLEVVG